MASLFDIAAQLSQYDEPEGPLAAVLLPAGRGAARHSGGGGKHVEKSSPRVACESPRSSNQDALTYGRQSALSLLDETLLAIYEARQPAPPPLPQLTSQRSAPRLVALSASKSVDELDRKLAKSISGGATSSPPPLQSVFSQAVAFASAGKRDDPPATQRRIPPPPPPLPPAMATTAARCADDADVSARNALRAIHEELERLPRDAPRSPAQLQRLRRALTEKYLDDRLNKLPSSPFVQLARKKALHKIDQLCFPPNGSGTTVETTATAQAPVATPAVFPTDQHEMLLKLARIPDAHVAKLSTTQQKMVQFAKRYDKIIKLSADELRVLPVSQTQLLRQLQQQMPATATAMPLAVSSRSNMHAPPRDQRL